MNLFAKIIFFIALASCTTSKNASNKSTASAKKNTTSKLYIVSGSATFTHSYCGGAPPSDEVSNNIKKPKPYVGKKFHVRKGEVNVVNAPIITSFTVDEQGLFSLTLPAGKYSIIQDEQVEPVASSKLESKNIKVNEECLKEWWEKPYYVLDVKSDVTDLKFEFHKRCFINSDIPCLQYTGPMPP